MEFESGFTLAEVLASVFILSATAVATSSILATTFASWERTDQLIERSEGLLTVAALIERQEARRRLDQVYASSEPYLVPDLLLARPRIDRSADCLYDLVGRHCR